MTWIYLDEYGQERPISERQMRSSLRSGRMGNHTPVRRENSDRWHQLGDITPYLPGGDPFDGTTTVFEYDPDHGGHSGADPAITREVARQQDSAAAFGHRVLGTDLVDLDLEPTPVTPHQVCPLMPTAPPRAGRLRAVLIDASAVAILVSISVVIAGMAGTDVDQRWSIAAVSAFVATAGWWTIWETLTTTTPGKRAFGIQVMGPELLPVRPRRALLRNAVRWALWMVPGLVLIELIAWWRDPEGRSWHDQLSGTSAVVRRGWTSAESVR